MAYGGLMMLLVFTSFVSKVENLKLRSNISQCSDRKLFRMQDSESASTGLASLPGKLDIKHTLQMFV